MLFLWDEVFFVFFDPVGLISTLALTNSILSEGAYRYVYALAKHTKQVYSQVRAYKIITTYSQLLSSGTLVRQFKFRSQFICGKISTMQDVISLSFYDGHFEPQMIPKQIRLQIPHQQHAPLYYRVKLVPAIAEFDPRDLICSKS